MLSAIIYEEDRLVARQKSAIIFQGGEIMREFFKEIRGQMIFGSMVKYGCRVLGRDVYNIKHEREDKLIQEQLQSKRKIRILTEIWLSDLEKSGM